MPFWSKAGSRQKGSRFPGKFVAILKSLFKAKSKSTGRSKEAGVRTVVQAESPGSHETHWNIDPKLPNLAERPFTPPRSHNLVEQSEFSNTKEGSDATGDDSGFFERDNDLPDEECGLGRVLPELEYDAARLSVSPVSSRVSKELTRPQPQVASRPDDGKLFVQERCVAITGKGTQCQALAAVGYQYCERWHLIEFLRKNDPTFDDSAYCQGITNKGAKCTRRAAPGEIYCKGEHLGKYGLRIKIEEPEWCGFDSDGPETNAQVLNVHGRSPRKSETNLVPPSEEPRGNQEDHSSVHRIAIAPVSCISKPQDSSSPPSSSPAPRNSRSRSREGTPCPDPPSPSSQLPSVAPELRRRKCRQQADDVKRCLGTTGGVVCSNTIESDSTYCPAHKGQRLHCNDDKFWFEENQDAAVSFGKWIPGYLSDETRRKLKEKMMQKLCTRDRDSHGLIYGYQLIDPKQVNQTHIKVGRTVNLAKRLENWRIQCGKELKPLGFWPPREAQVGPGTYRGARYHEIIESLVLLELNDVAVHSLHLLPGFPHNAEISQRPHYRKGKREPCDGPNCNGTVHCEIFSFERRENEERQEADIPKEWESIVWPIIDKWGVFAELYLEGRALS